MSNFNPFNDLKKLTIRQMANLSISGASLPEDHYTDGLGNIYLAPEDGVSRGMRISHDPSHLARYNFKLKTVEIYHKDTGAIILGLSCPLSDWLDNPMYTVTRLVTAGTFL